MIVAGAFKERGRVKGADRVQRRTRRRTMLASRAPFAEPATHVPCSHPAGPKDQPPRELETSNEELQATNEELVASNEELQSTNEELHSVNEELYTVNAEYQQKIAELTELNATWTAPARGHRRRHDVPRPRAAHPQVHAEDRARPTLMDDIERVAARRHHRRGSR